LLQPFGLRNDGDARSFVITGRDPVIYPSAAAHNLWMPVSSTGMTWMNNASATGKPGNDGTGLVRDGALALRLAPDSA